MKLDIGCGSRKTGSEYVGLDLLRGPNVNVRASATALPFRNESFVEIYTRRCFQHIEDDEKAIGEVSRVLEKTEKQSSLLHLGEDGFSIRLNGEFG